MARRKPTKQQSLPDPDRKRALARTVQEFPGGGGPISFILQLALTADEAPRWWSPARDRYLDKFWPTEPFLAGAIYSVSSRNASFRWELTGPRDQVKWSQRLLCQADFGDGWQSFMMKVTQDLLCLGARSTIMLGGDRRGKRKRVRNMVLDQDEGPVLTVAPDGTLTERRVTGWHKTPLGDRRWMWLSLRDSSHHGRKKRGGLWLTHDHKVLTPSGWIAAENLRDGDSVISGFPEPSERQAPLIVGTMLGDACMRMKNGRSSAMLRLGHSIAQVEWLELKRDSLSGFGWNPLYTHVPSGEETIEGRLVNAKPSVSSASLCTPGLAKWFEAFYPNGKKVVPRELVERYFSPLMLASWFLDDGTRNRFRLRDGRMGNCFHISLYTNSFTKEDVIWLADLLTQRGFSAKACSMRSGKKKKTYWYIHLNAKAARKFEQVVAPYIPPSMRYKLSDDAPLFDPSLWDLGQPKMYVDVVEIIEEKQYRSGPSGTYRTAYCLDVEGTQNFSASGVIVHNCQGNGAFIEIIRPAKARINGKSYDAVRAPHPDSEEYIWYAYDRSTGEVYNQYEHGFKVQDSPLSLPIGIAHLDTARVTRTGDPDYPVVYTDLQGGQHKLGFHQVLSLAEMPSPREEWKGVQVSAVDRVLKLSQILRDLSTYKSEKVSGRFARAIHLTNIDADTIQDAVNQANESADSRGLLRYMQPIVAATLDPNARPEVATLELASLPSGFDEETTMRWYIAGLATVLGVDYGFLAPLPGSKLGTAAQAETQERQARGKSSRLFMRMLAHKFNYSGVLPRSVVFKFAQTDPYEESERDRAFARRTRARSTAIRSGEITPEIARQLAADVGDLDLKYLAMMGEGDISPIVTVDGETLMFETDELLPRHLVPGPPSHLGQPEEREE